MGQLFSEYMRTYTDVTEITKNKREGRRQSHCRCMGGEAKRRQQKRVDFHKHVPYTSRCINYGQYLWSTSILPHILSGVIFNLYTGEMGGIFLSL